MVYGGSSAGIAAAVQIKRMGGKVVVIEPSKRIGGLTTGGLGQTDIGNKHVIGGISREFYKEVRDWYDRPEVWKWEEKPSHFVGTGQSKTAANEDTLWTFEPTAALSIYEAWAKKNQLEIIYGERLNREGEGKSKNRGDGYYIAAPGSVAKGVIKDGAKITAIVMESGRRFEGKMFMDASYEGDLMAGSGVAFTVGREGKAIFGESLNGVQTEYAKHHQLLDGVDPYVKPGDATSGLLKWIDPEGPGKEGASDHRIQAYCFRMCLTDHPDNRIPFEKPEGYDESWYELLFRNYAAGSPKGLPWINSGMPNRKTDTNNRDGFSTDFIGQNYEWPEGSYEKRVAIRQKHLQYQQGLMWTLANHERVPDHVREEYSKWGMTKDEFVEGEGWQEQIYVREGRRMISAIVMTQAHCQQEIDVENSVGMGAYTMDSHHTQRHINDKGFVKNEGDVQVGGFPPYPIAYESIVPKKEECENLLVPIALSASHISFGSIRMEPVFMILGQSGATAAMHAIEEGKALQDIDMKKLQTRLLADKQVLNYKEPTLIQELKSIKGVVVDDSQAKYTGNWLNSTLRMGVHKGFLHEGNGEHGAASATFTLKVQEAGRYSVQLASVPNSNRSTRTKVEVKAQGNHNLVTVNQRVVPQIDKTWIPLKNLELKAGDEVEVVVKNEDADGFVVVDAVRLLPIP